MSPTETLKSLSFGGHESFVFRQGWLKKGIDSVAKTPTAFLDEDAVVKLGVGKNMVRSIRTWCLATQMICESAPEGNSRFRPLRVSDLGESILGDGGWDPYCEDPATLWLLHWLLLTNDDKLSLWRLAFMHFREREFSKADIVTFTSEHIRSQGGKTESGTLDRDADCFIRTYLPSRSRAGSSTEEDFDCPMSELGLILSASKDRYGFAVGSKESLSPEVFAFAMAEFLQQPSGPILAASVSSLTYESGSPGQAFKLTEDAVIELGRDLEIKFSEQVFVDVDGPVRRMGFRRRIEPLHFLHSYYAGVGS